MRQRVAVKLVVTTILAVASGACSLLFAPNEDQCSNDGDCTARGNGFAATRCSADKICTSDLTARDAGAEAATDSAPGPFACANDPRPKPDPSKQVEATIGYTDNSTGMAPDNTLVRLCSGSDPTCANARLLQGEGPGDAGPEGGTGWVQTRANGTVSAQVEYGFEGFFEARGTQYPPSFRNVSPPLVRPTTTFDSILLRPAEIKFLTDQAVKPNAYDPVGHGIVFLLAKDCNEQALANVSFTTSAPDDGTLYPFYIINSSPSTTDTKTDSLGRGGYINAPPGIHTFNAFIGEGSQKRRYGSTRAVIRAGANTTVVVEPSP